MSLIQDRPPFVVLVEELIRRPSRRTSWGTLPDSLCRDDERLQSLAQPDREAAAGADGRRQQPVAGCALGLIGQSDVTVLSFLAAEFLQRVAERRLAVLKLLYLRCIMGIDRFLHRDGAGHG